MIYSIIVSLAGIVSLYYLLAAVCLSLLKSLSAVVVGVEESVCLERKRVNEREISRE